MPSVRTSVRVVVAAAAAGAVLACSQSVASPALAATARPAPQATARPVEPQQPTVQRMRLACITGRGATLPTAKCAWSQSTARDFHHYLLIRAAEGGPREVVFRTEDRAKTSYVDQGLRLGVGYAYVVEAFDRAGRLVGRSAVEHVRCCAGGRG